ncbi:hypothetical protein HW130_34380 [Streptomyces sp. PKU-EA00015]|uniref:hypothetical protein n=1 Tax=Streptomyces sp. PKU-EA00015 TaxID=2748326 RepID=UPI0015A2D936|nr:hypothetical protein [Streptomyces sp. PKU-EA00015]NWF31257.1 hypothetical protein [Streptomyces sp. PKU-EA00015]
MRRRRRTGIVAVALCLGGALTACSGSDDDGRIPLGAAGAGPAPTGAVPPKGGVVLVPLDEPDASGSPRTPAGRDTPAPPLPDGPSRDEAPPAAERPGTGAGDSADAPSPSSPGDPSPRPPSPAPTPEPPPSGSPAPPAGPALLQLTEPVREALDERWCERVTVEFRNTGGRAATSGTVTFATHVIGALGIDWATIETAQPLPAPIGPGAVRKKVFTVCVEAWRVPLGMHIETRDVTAEWT